MEVFNVSVIKIYKLNHSSLAILLLTFGNFNLTSFLRTQSFEDPYKCFERDQTPVDTHKIFEEKCQDHAGNLFKPGSDPLTSCCQCLEYE